MVVPVPSPAKLLTKPVYIEECEMIKVESAICIFAADYFMTLRHHETSGNEHDISLPISLDMISNDNGMDGEA